MSEDQQGQTQPTSKYNSAMAQLFRLDELWKDAHRHSRAGQYDKWNGDLDMVWSELARDLKPDTNKSHKKIEEEYRKFTERLGKAGSMSKGEIRGFSSNNVDKSAQYIILLEKEIWLGRLQNSLGKGTKWDEDEDEYFD